MRARSCSPTCAVLAGLFALGLAPGCSEEPGLTSVQLAARTTDLGASLARQVVEATEFIQELESLTALGNGMEMVFSGEDGEAPQPYPAPLPPPEDEADPAEEVAQALADFLNEQVFAPANLESEEPGLAIYRLRGAALCAEDMFGPSYGCDDDWGCMPEDRACLDDEQAWRQQCLADEAAERAACVEDVDALEIRVRVEEAGAGVRLGLLVGPQRAEVFSLTLAADGMELVTDLAEARLALVHALGVLGEEPAQVPEQMQGVLALALQKNAERDFSLTSAVRQAVVVRYRDAELGLFEVQAAAADPASSLRVEGVARRLTAALGAGAVDVSWPAGAMFEQGQGVMALALGGLTGELVLEAASDRLVLTGLGLGQDGLALTLDGSPLFALDVDPAGDGRFDLELSALDGLPVAGVAGGLDALVFVALERLDAFLGLDEEPAPDELRSQTYALSVIPGAGGQAQVTLVDGQELAPDALRVLAGSLLLTSSAVTAELALTAGQCATWSEECAEELNFILECAQIAACP